MSEDREISLNPKQKQVVEHEGSPLLVVAGPGTGKTRVITEKIRYLISKKEVDPQNILALTFTEKAAEEMLSRVDEVMPLGYEEPWLSTFHSFCDRILRLSGLEIGLDPDFKIMTAPEQWLFLREHLFDFDLEYFRPLGNPSKFISALLAFFSRLQDEDVSPSEFSKFVEDKRSRRVQPASGGLNPIEGDAEIGEQTKLEELARAYETYQRLKLAESKMDFGDLISWTLKLFRERPSVLAKYQDQFQYILVDEFQDTNYAQYQLIKLLAPAKASPNLLVVGDDLQAIYKFRGASLSNILNFKRDYPEAETVVLNRDYRNPQPIIDSVLRLSKKNEPNTLEAKIGIDKRLQSSAGSSQRSAGKGIEVIAAETGEEEAEEVVARIVELAKEEGYGWRDFAILARANAHLDSFVAALKRAGIPYQLLGNRGLFDQPEVKELIAFLRVVADPENGPALFELLRSSAFGIDSKIVTGLLNLSRKTRRPLWEVIEEARDEDEGVSLLVREVENARADVLRKPPTRLLYDFVMNSGFVERFLAEESIENQLKIKNLNLFFERIKKFEASVSGPTRRSLGEGGPTVPGFVSYLDLLMEAGENPAQAEIEDIDTVSLLTVHSAKGLEFPVVFLVNLVAGRFPARRRGEALAIPDELVKDILPEGDQHLQEERRLFYVGCTRASERLFLTWARDYGGKRERKPSGFIKELGIDHQQLVACPECSRGKRSRGVSGQLEGERVEKVKKVGKPLSFFTPEKMSGAKWKMESAGFKPAYVSYSQLETFKQCPLKYKYRYVLGIPTPPNHVLSFGQTIHRVLRDFHRADLFQKKNLDYLLELYERHWIDEGYDSKEHKEQRFAEGKELLKRYYEKHSEKLGRPIYLEKKFTLKVDGTPLVGSIDRVDETKQGIEIIDYKTGGIKNQRAVDKDEQLTIYALAARNALNLNPRSLALYFIDGNIKVSTTRTAEQLDAARKSIKETIESIKKSDFSPTPNFLCGWCDYRHICPAYKVGE